MKYQLEHSVYKILAVQLAAKLQWSFDSQNVNYRMVATIQPMQQFSNHASTVTITSTVTVAVPASLLSCCIG